ncbi:MAG TPA: aspartate--tRNA ligase [Caldisericia bacterium]|nr:aspartate--tRNA ligase [Caldisericia bacterium]HOL82873.1 aspartate--tRNA ligase [Caldisericia bacterium]HPC56356.1 aspartate--tRNA ligase [Caldisericia bacterium]HPP43218.1 aspartate--tRNA ligase [Caldisericia bacterium]
MVKRKYCGEITEENIGKNLTIYGWIKTIRNLGGLIFFEVRDRSGFVQVVVDSNQKEIFEIAKKIGNEWVVKVTGDVRERPKENINENIKTGKIEINCKELEIINESLPLPFEIDSEGEINEILRLKYRFLDFRGEEMKKNLYTRFKISTSVREFLNSEGFWEIETPILTKSTPEGARDFLVPSRINPGKFYALPQSPQLFKQILMISGLDKYYQIARCFRDEDLRADRQPEFTQIDVEMSFVDEENIMNLTDRLFKKLFKDVLNIDIEIPLMRMKYFDAMEKFGTDKPDLRFSLEINDFTDIFKHSDFSLFKSNIEKNERIKGFLIKNVIISRKEKDEIENLVKENGIPGLIALNIEKKISSPLNNYINEDELNKLKEIAESNDTILFFIGSGETFLEKLGKIRIDLAKKYNLIDLNKHKLLWITDFPLFEWNKEENRWDSRHHPFTSPKSEDIELLDKDPSKVFSRSYDIVMDGFEIGGGSIRIDNIELQKKIFNILGYSEKEVEDRFDFFINALKYGTPIHGGIALGLDRIVMLFINGNSLRDVIPFPKTQKGTCPLTNAPSEVSKDQLKELKIKIED